MPPIMRKSRGLLSVSEATISAIASGLVSICRQ
ncbi:uncharacterized protein FFB20_06037 [Fusarium fujikuroi]|nr:uncharacterized protein FFB20_06037 [Fusarium fujikuroi]